MAKTIVGRKIALSFNPFNSKFVLVSINVQFFIIALIIGHYLLGWKLSHLSTSHLSVVSVKDFY